MSAARTETTYGFRRRSREATMTPSTKTECVFMITPRMPAAARSRPRRHHRRRLRGRGASGRRLLRQAEVLHNRLEVGADMPAAIKPLGGDRSVQDRNVNSAVGRCGRQVLNLLEDRARNIAKPNSNTAHFVYHFILAHC